MTTSANSSANSGVPDKTALWGWWYAGQKWQQDLQKKATYKALDIPEDDMGDISSNKSIRTGMGWPELAVLAVAGLGAGYLWQSSNSTTVNVPTAPPPAAASPADSEYEVRFFDADGNPIKVPHISDKDKK